MTITDIRKLEMLPGLEIPSSLAERKKFLLNKLTSPTGKTKYKRYIGSPLRYAGGKSLAVGLIVELIPDNTKRIISPFLGGGSVEVARATELGLPVIVSDIFDVRGGEAASLRQSLLVGT